MCIVHLGPEASIRTRVSRYPRVCTNHYTTTAVCITKRKQPQARRTKAAARLTVDPHVLLTALVGEDAREVAPEHHGARTCRSKGVARFGRDATHLPKPGIQTEASSRRRELRHCFTFVFPCVCGGLVATTNNQHSRCSRQLCWLRQ